MERFKSFQLTAQQQRKVVGGGSITAQCAGEATITCTGSVCLSQDADPETGRGGSCSCDGPGGELKFCKPHEE